MLSRLRYFALCGMILSIAYFITNFTGSNVFAETAKTKEELKAHADPHHGKYGEWKHGGHSDVHKTQVCKQKGCKQKGCARQHEGHHGGHGGHDMMGLVHVAKKDLLKEKIKAKLEAKIGGKLDKAADLLIETMLEKKQLKDEDKKLREDLHKKLGEIFSAEGQN